RIDDGMMGEVRLQNGEPRIVYLDRGQLRVAERKEQWEPVKQAPNRLRPEEIAEVARAADRTLRALDQHQPIPFWFPVRPDEPVYDEGLVSIISRYLPER